MAKNMKLGWILMVALAIIIIIGQGGKQSRKLAGESLIRVSSDTQVQIDDTFTIKYSVVNQGASPFFFSIDDNIGGGCTSFGSTDIITTLTSPQSETGDITITAPSSPTTCTFTGDWKLGSGNIINFPSLDVSVVSPSCTQNTDCPSDTDCKDWSCTVGECASVDINEAGSCNSGVGLCQAGECITLCVPSWDCTDFSPLTCPSSCEQTRICTDTNACGDTTGKPEETQACTGGSCGTTTCTDGDTDVCAVGSCVGQRTCTNGQWGTCTKVDQTCGVENDTSVCEFHQTEKDGKCVLSSWVYGVIIFFALMFALKTLS